MSADYEKYTEEMAHYHTEAIEFQYVVSGWTKYFDLDEKKEYEFKAGDFYTIYPNTKYAQTFKAELTPPFR